MANNLRALRESRSWSQDHAAQALGTTRNQYAKLEAGSRRLSDVWIARAAAAFGIDAGDVVTDRRGLVPIVGYVGAALGSPSLRRFAGAHGRGAGAGGRDGQHGRGRSPRRQPGRLLRRVARLLRRRPLAADRRSSRPPLRGRAGGRPRAGQEGVPQPDRSPPRRPARPVRRTHPRCRSAMGGAGKSIVPR